MNNGIELGYAVFYVNGKEMGTLNSIETKVELNNEVLDYKKDFRFSNKEYIGTLENVEISKDFVNLFPSSDQKYKLVATSYNLPRGNRLPKKKRVRNKWMKKYVKSVEFDNVAFEGVDECLNQN